MATRGGGGVVYTDNPKERRGINIENPFTLKVGQVFTGFGFGCGLGIGVGRPLNLGAIPVLNQVMVATRGATDAFSGVQRHVNSSLKRVGAKNIEAGIGCGVGFGHGFGVGIALKPSVLHQIQSQFSKLAAHVVNKFGIDSSATTPLNKGILPASLQTGSNSTFHGNIRDGTIGSSVGTLARKTGADNTEYGSRTEAVLNNFLKNPLLQGEGSLLHEQDGALQSENNVLQMVLKHQVLIEELMEENKKLRQILMEELKVQPSNLQSSFTSKRNPSCTECFECRRKQRRR